jgi:hypothetical protein
VVRLRVRASVRSMSWVVLRYFDLYLLALCRLVFFLLYSAELACFVMLTQSWYSFVCSHCCLGFTCLVLVCIFLCSVSTSVVLSFSPHIRESGPFDTMSDKATKAVKEANTMKSTRFPPFFFVLLHIYVLCCYIPRCLFILVFPLYCCISILSLYLLVPSFCPTTSSSDRKVKEREKTSGGGTIEPTSTPAPKDVESTTEV